MSAKIHFREGNSPDRWLRILIDSKCHEESERIKPTGRWAWKQPSFNESVKAHRMIFFCIENKELKILSEIAGIFFLNTVAERSIERYKKYSV